MVRPKDDFMTTRLFALLFFTAILSNSLSAAEPPGTLTLEVAQKLANKAANYARKKKWAVSIAVVNADGNLIYFQRDDHSYSGSIEVSIQKARSASAFQRPTSAFAELIKQGRLGILAGKDIVPIEGGLPIVLSGKHAGAIGISGAKATEDEECGKAALASLTGSE
jgi:glc operon protein GlcG